MAFAKYEGYSTMDDGCKLFVANLGYSTGQSELEELFSKVGTVTEVRVAEDRETGQSKGFAFIVMGSSQDAQKAIDEMNGIDVDGRSLRVQLSKPREGGSGGFSGGGGGARTNVCYAFQNGNCQRGESCRFDHGGNGGGGGGYSGGGGNYGGGGYGGGGQTFSGGGGGGGGGGLCFDFQKGNCQRGDSCRFSHEGGGGGFGGGGYNNGGGGGGGGYGGSYGGSFGGNGGGGGNRNYGGY